MKRIHEHWPSTPPFDFGPVPPDQNRIPRHDDGVPQYQGSHGMFGIKAPQGFAVYENTTGQALSTPWTSGPVANPYEQPKVDIGGPVYFGLNGEPYFRDTKGEFWTTDRAPSPPPAKESPKAGVKELTTPEELKAAGFAPLPADPMEKFASTEKPDPPKSEKTLVPEAQQLYDRIKAEFDKGVEKAAESYLKKAQEIARSRHLAYGAGNIYNQIKSALNSESRRSMDQSLDIYRQTTMSEASPDALDQAAIAVHARYYRHTGQFNPNVKFPQASQRIDNVNKYMLDLLQGQELQNPANIAKAESVIGLMILEGCESIGGSIAGAEKKLEDALDLMEAYADAVPGFNVANAGLIDAKVLLMHQLGALDADKRHNPHHEYAYMGRGAVPVGLANKTLRIQANALYGIGREKEKHSTPDLVRKESVSDDHRQEQQDEELFNMRLNADIAKHREDIEDAELRLLERAERGGIDVSQNYFWDQYRHRESKKKLLPLIV